ncbi:hypothetical protein L2725_05125 [Shewanella corallii]|uniref:Uncharacterized protein n=1 Tax=Shewanella corallii TaxID=560080 RepID=A0ABT0N3W8_9GAMM|nr:lipid II flippase MurJ [Shewanella corallii]MCL2913166.1 hypothetical protein [Shewanella corallii]
MASKFGVGTEIDSYTFVFSLANWPISLALSLLTVLLIPILNDKDTNDKDNFLKEIFGSIIYTSATVSLVFFLYFYFYGKNYNASNEINNIVKEIYPIYIPYIFISLLAAFFSTVMMAHGDNKNSLFESCVPIATLMLTALFSTYLAVSYGVLLGAVFQFILLYTFVSKFVIYPRFSFRNSGWKKIKLGAFTLIVGQVLISSTTIIDQLIASNLYTGSLSSISYATKVSSIFMVIVSLAITRAMLPIISKSIALPNNPVDKAYILKWCLGLFFLGGIITTVCWIFSYEIIEIIYFRGEFSENDIVLVSKLLSISVLQFPFYFSAMVLVCFYNAKRMYKVIMFSGVVGFIAKLSFYYINRASFNSELIMLSTVFMYITTFLFLLILLIFKRELFDE